MSECFQVPFDRLIILVVRNEDDAVLTARRCAQIRSREMLCEELFEFFSFIGASEGIDEDVRVENVFRQSQRSSNASIPHNSTMRSIPAKTSF